MNFLNQTDENWLPGLQDMNSAIKIGLFYSQSVIFSKCPEKMPRIFLILTFSTNAKVERERERILYLRNLFTGGLERDKAYITIIQTKGFLWG